jgi:hypothetical protein
MAAAPKALWTKIAKGPRRRHSPLSGSGEADAEAAVVCVTREMREDIVGVGMSTPRWRREVAIAVAVASLRREVGVGSRPGGGSISFCASARYLMSRYVALEETWASRYGFVEVRRCWLYR